MHRFVSYRRFGRARSLCSDRATFFGLFPDVSCFFRRALRGRGRVIDVRWVQKKGGSSYNPEIIRVNISQKREIKVGDELPAHSSTGMRSEPRAPPTAWELTVSCSI
uniref:Uncharacterized protein n=1 Tax=Brassica oleracea var. oleracea TaxID=109376 RepID=A0A0D3C385_BRAOL